MLKEINYYFDEIREEDRVVFCDMLSYLSPYIFSIVKNSKNVVLEVDASKEADILEKIKSLKAMLESEDMKQNHEIATKTIADFSDRMVLNSEPIFNQLIASGSIVKASEGVFIYGGLFLDICKYFSAKIDAFGKSLIDSIIEYDMPNIYPIKDYERGLYFESFPHHIMFQTSIKNDIDVLNEFSRHGTNGGKIFKNIETPTHILRHAACAPIYPMLEDACIDTLRAYLVSGKCFRNEGLNVFELARLKEFYMKEYVFVGEQDQIKAYIEKSKDLWYYWIETFQLNCYIETANDSFFASNYKKLKIFQILGDSKQEFKIWIPSSGMFCAVSSSNIHRTHFTKAHNIRGKQSYSQSACFAFGIERLAYALLSQKGLDISKWDEKSRIEVFSK